MTTFPKKLKDPRTCRVFISSPFGGCEKEREELVRKYYPQLSHLCQSKGVNFAPVDMRWGITEERASDCQVINICLREVDRSDIFVGYYGQRYGWHGANDTSLQKNIQNAIDRYPWLSTVRDRSVTEMEFLHGHLNNPGALPAIMAFRDKNFDDVERTKAKQRNDNKTVSKYTAESNNSTMLLQSLKDRVISTRDKCLSLSDNYQTPEEGASFVFEQIKKHLETVLLKSQISVNKRDLDLLSHNAYMMSRVSIFVGGDDHEKTLNQALDKGNHKVLITGPTGSGKGALLAHWLYNFQKRKSKKLLVYHFVGCSSDSASIPEVLNRLTSEILHLREGIQKSRSNSLQNLDEELKPKPTELSDLCREFELVLGKAALKRDIVLAIDGLGKVQNTSRIAKTLFWLPNHLPQNVTIVCTCREKDTDIIEELQSRGYNQLYIPQLSKELRQEMCSQLLTHNSKELSSKQLQKIVNSAQSGSPLYLKTVISELCAFGQFRELDAKIDQLMACPSVKELYQVLLQRLEADYNTHYRTGDIIERVMCSIRVSRKGLSETELMEIHSIPSKEWSPLFFAMQHMLVVMAGLLTFGFHELTEAVDERYMKSKGAKLKYQKIVTEYFDKQRKLHTGSLRLDDPSMVRPADELPWLISDMGDKKKLKEVLADLSILGRLFIGQEFELLQLWRCVGLPGEEIADLYLQSIKARAKMALKSAGKNTESEGSLLNTLIFYLNGLSYFMEMASYRTAQEKILLAEMDMLEKASSYLPQMSLKRNQAVIKTKLAYLYTDLGRYGDAIALQSDILEYRNENLKNAVGDTEEKAALKGLASIYHGIAVLNSKLDKISEAIEYYTKAMEVQTQLDDEVELAESLHNLGVMYMKIGKHQQALDLCTNSLKIYQSVYFTNQPPVIGVMIGNIAACYRNLGQVEEAEAMYKKALEIAERAVGRQHPQFALGLMNLGTLEINRERFDQAEIYIRECIEIFEKCETPECDCDYYKSLEKFVYVLIKVNKIQEARDRFNKMFKIAVKEKFLDISWPNTYVLMVDCLIELKQFKLAHDVAMALLTSKQAQDKSYIQYDTICKALKLKPKQEYTLENALRKRPGSLALLRHTIEKKFIPEGLLQKIIESLDEAETSMNIGSDLYGTAVTWCEEANSPTLALGVLEHAINLYPQEANFVCGLAQYYYEDKNWEKAKEYSRQMCQLEPDNPNHFLLYGDMALQTDDLDQARKTLSEILILFKTDVAVVSQAQDALDMLNKMEIRRSGPSV